MCGRYASTASTGDVANLFGAVDETGDVLVADYNVAPTKDVPIVVTRPGADGGVGRRIRAVRWGLVPHWSKDPSGGAKMINARSETVATKPAFRTALSARRCIVPATGWYEWQRTAGERRGQPWFIRGADGEALAFAGLYEVWRDGEGYPLATCTIMTAPAPGPLARIHDRAPVTLTRDAWDRWLDPAIRDPAAVVGLLVPADPSSLTAHRVGPEVGNVKNNSAELMRPIPPDEPPAGSPPAGRADLTLWS